MSKKKKPPQTASQKLKKRVSACCGAAARRFKSGTETAGKALSSAGTAVYGNVSRFLQYKFSAVLLTVFFLLLMALTTLLMGRSILYKTFPLAFPISFPFYLIDYSVGFVSRALVGQIVAFFTDSVSVNMLLVLTRTVTILSLAVRAGLAAVTFKRAFLNRSPLICLLCVYFAVSPITVMCYQIYLGFLDPYNMMLTVLYLFVSNKKAAYILTPLICFTGIVLHYQFILSFLPLILSVELYYICMEKQGRGLRIASLTATVLGSAALTVYLMFYSKYNTRMDADALYTYMCNKFTDFSTWGLFEEYFTYYIYGDFEGMNYSNPLDFVKFLVTYSLERTSTYSLVGYAVGIAPVVCFTEYLWGRMAIRAKGAQKLPYLVFMLQPLLLAGSVIAITDNGRSFGASIFSMFSLLYITCRREDPLIYETAKKAEKPAFLLLCAAAMAIGYALSFSRINHMFI